MNKITLVIPVLNRKETTLQCLESVYCNIPDGISVIVVDSGSTDGTQAMVNDRFKDVVLLQAEQEDWWAGATNIGILKALENGSDGILTFNDDNIATPALFTHLLATASANLHSIVSAVCCYKDHPDRIFFAGRKRSAFTGKFYYLFLDRPYSVLKSDKFEVDLLHGMCTLFPASVFQIVGLFDEINFPHLFADDDLVLRAKKHGYQLLIEPNAKVLNDREKTGLDPYSKKLSPSEFIKLFISRKSVFQLNTRTKFLWRHKRSMPQFALCWCLDYSRILFLVILRWVTTECTYAKLVNMYFRYAYK